MNTIKKTGTYEEGIILRAKLEKDIVNWLKYHKKGRGGCNIVSRAITFYYDYLFNRKGLLLKLIQEDFELCKHLIRIVGQANKREAMRNEEMSSL